ncbi:hypothetical protein WA026_013014 [Henosepilachna vigintioctopunctata]|uniref:Calcineurin-binding protein cabin-1 n=1 Tax=Henosepilachna vigintioctopunctata TaxID=420089 RepID=A0AAW1TWU4_9CUCU
MRQYSEKSFRKTLPLKSTIKHYGLRRMKSGLPKSLSTLKYSCYLNIGDTYLAEKDNVNALDNFLIASQLDESDVTLWYKIGKLAMQENRFRQSIYAFSKGLDCNGSHWPCLDEIISLLFAVRDSIGCLYYIGKALILDSEYVKGLVFRKHIYKNNPASKDYYQKSNPDYIWEPSLDVELNEQDELKYLGEVQCIIDKINETEKQFESKGLSTIPLPKALEDYSWMAVSKSVISLYQYVRTNELSFFTFVDINKCMSNLPEENVTDANTEDMKDIEPIADTNNVENTDISKNDSKMDVQSIVERRFSQNSEENGTPSQTDNDEEQQTEQDTEEQEERNEKSRARGYKRKRDLLLDLRVWGWHSKRKNVRKTKPDKFYTVEDCLNQVLPPHLLQNKVGDTYSQDDSMNTMDIYNLFLDNRQMNILSPIHSPESSNFKPYFGTDREKEDVIKSWTRPREYCDICVLVKEFVLELCELWNIKWPKELIAQFIIAYEIYREFYELPSFYDPENLFENVRKETLATLLYAELVLFSCPKDLEKARILHIGQIQFLETMTSLWEHNWGEEYIAVFTRVLWLRAYIFRKEGSNESAVRYFQLMEEIITEEEKRLKGKFSLVLPNCIKCGFISIEVAKKILNHLDMIKSISCLEDLFNQEKYKDVADIVKSTFAPNSGCPTFGKVGRPAQLGMLLHSLWFTDFGQCFIWSEECLFEANVHYNRPGPDRTRWEKVVEKCLGIMHEIIKHESRNVVELLSNNKKARLTETLAKIICKQINAENTPTIPLNTVIPWILLHHLLAKDEENARAKDNKPDDKEDSEDIVPPSLSILFSAHEFLGPKSWCLTNQGQLLHYILDILLDKDDVYKYERLREKLDIQIEQALFCLYQHPSKKNKISRHLADHNVDPLPLTWEKSFQLYEFYAPEVLPEFNSFKNLSISMDLEQLLLRITALVIPECDTAASIPKINDYLQGKTDKIPDPIEFPNRIRAIYYLLGDYYFKFRDFVRCVKYFLMDLAINPHRIDSWACLGLSFCSQLEIELNYCKKINSEEFLEKAKCAQVGFKTALNLSPNDITLWIEFGSFEYMAHSFCSRYLKFESENMNMERFEYLENQKNTLLDTSGQSFEKAIALYEMNDNEPDERWLQYYILGKIAEKKQTEPNEYLNYYLTASQLLEENNATYPDKIMYNSPQHLSVEALELHYRVNSSILKYLELHEEKQISSAIGSLFKKSLDALTINQKLAAQRAQKKLEKSNQIKSNDNIKIDEPVATAMNPETKKEVVEAITNDNSENVIGTNFISTTKPEESNFTHEGEETLKDKVVLPDDNTVSENDSILTNSAMDTEIKESVDNLLQKVEEIEKEKFKANSPAVQVVDEVILLDSEYDVIMILSSDEDEEENSNNGSSGELEKIQTHANGEEISKDISSIKTAPAENVENQAATLLTTKNTIDDCGVSETGDVPMDTSEGNALTDSVCEKAVPHDDNLLTPTGMDVQQVLDKMMDEMMQVSMLQDPLEQQIEVDSDASIVEKSIELLEGNISGVNNIFSEKCSNKNDEINEDKKTKDNTCDKNLENLEEHEKIIEDSSSSSSSLGSSDSSCSSNSDTDDSSSSSTSSSSDESTNENLSRNDILHLVDRCVRGLEQCIIRLSKNYKAIYRLIHLFFNYKAKRDLNKCKQLLLGEYKCYENTTVTGLFSDRKATNFFNGVWRIPSSEIDRPGSLAAHMSRCVTILLQILSATNECKILLDLYFQLKKTPDPDKVVIKDSERLQFSEQALSLCIQSFRNNIKNEHNMSNSSLKKLLNDIYKAYMLVEVYKLSFKEIPDNANILELAIKFCQQNKILEKQRSVMNLQNNTLKNPLIPMGPVLPSPSTVNSGTALPIKRLSGSGRPRGRPPLNKIPSPLKSSSIRSLNTLNSNQSNWKKSLSEQAINYDYLKHYQEELMKQYNQNLNYMQMAQLAQLYQNPTAFANAYMQAQQNSMLNANLLNQLPIKGMPGSVINKNSTSQMEALQSQFNEILAMMKKGSALGNFNIDQLMASTSTKSNIPLNKSRAGSPISVSKNLKTTNPEWKSMNTNKTFPPKIDKEIPKADNVRSSISDELTKKISNASTSKVSSQTNNISIIKAQVHEKRELPSASCVSSISIIPRENIIKTKEHEKNVQLLKIGATVSKLATNETMHIKTNKSDLLSVPNLENLTSMESTMKKSISSISATFPSSKFTPVSTTTTPVSNIMPPPSPIVISQNSPLSISSLSPSSGSSTVKLSSSQKVQPVIGIKESSRTIPNLNIEAMISRVSPTATEHKKYSTDMDIPPLSAQITNFALEAGLPKFPSSLSMTPVNVPLKPVVEPQQSITLHKLPLKKSDSNLSKLPSGVTLTPSVTKTYATGKLSHLEGHNKSHTEHTAMRTATSKTYQISSSMSTPQTHQLNKNFSKPSSNTEVHSKVPTQTDFIKTTKSSQSNVPKKNEPNTVLTAFNIESMLKSSTKPRSISSSNRTFNYHSLPTNQKVAHTSVITNMNKTPITHNVTSKLPMFSHNPLDISNRNVPKSATCDVKNMTFSGPPPQSKTSSRTPTSEFYKIDDRRTYDAPLGNIYPSARQERVNIPKSSKSSPTPVISTITRTTPNSTYVPPHVQTSPGKTLQEKLADKKREQASKQFFQQIEKHQVSKDVSNFSNPHGVSKMLAHTSSGEGPAWTESPYGQRCPPPIYQQAQVHQQVQVHLFDRQPREENPHPMNL